MTFESLIASFNRLPARIRVAATAAAAALALGVISISIASHAPRVKLFAQPLHPEQLAEVEEELAAWSVPFSPAADNVVVDAGRRNDVLLKLSLAGVPHAHVRTSDETMANVGVLTPQTVVDAQARSGLAGDIELSLRTIAGVDDARVIIAPAQTAEFADESPRDASAAVRLRLHPGASLGADAIAGIRRFVAAGVPGLDASRVTVLDDRGVALDDRSAGAGDSDTLAHSLQSALDAALGTGVAIVRVHTEYTGTDVERRSVRRVPLNSPPIESTDTTESYAGAGKRYEKRDLHDDRGSDTNELVSRSSPQTVARVSTAVAIDASRGFDVPKIRELAAAAVGFNPHRGDTLVVQAVDFHRALTPKRDGWMLLYGAVVPLLPTLALIAAALTALRYAAPALSAAFKASTERVSLERAARAVAGYAPARVRSALAHEPPHAAAAIISALPAATAAAVLELYPPHEREGIVRRMQRAHAPIVPGADEVLGSHA